MEENILLEKNEILMKNIDLPLDYGETCADESMKPLNDFIDKIIHKIENSRESTGNGEMGKE